MDSLTILRHICNNKKLPDANIVERRVQATTLSDRERVSHAIKEGIRFLIRDTVIGRMQVEYWGEWVCMIKRWYKSNKQNLCETGQPAFSTEKLARIWRDLCTLIMAVFDTIDYYQVTGDCAILQNRRSQNAPTSHQMRCLEEAKWLVEGCEGSQSEGKSR